MCIIWNTWVTSDCSQGLFTLSSVLGIFLDGAQGTTCDAKDLHGDISCKTNTLPLELLFHWPLKSQTLDCI